MNEEEFERFADFVQSEAGAELIDSMSLLFYDAAFVIALITNVLRPYLLDRALYGAIGEPYYAEVQFRGDAKYRITLEALDG